MRPLDEGRLITRQLDDAHSAIVRGGALVTAATLVLLGALVTSAPIAIAFGGMFALLGTLAGVTLIRTGTQTRAKLRRRLPPPARLLQR